MGTSHVVIQLRNVSKRYERRALTLRDSLAQLLGRHGQLGTATQRRGDDPHQAVVSGRGSKRAVTVQ